jgi:hypothetical protein
MIALLFSPACDAILQHRTPVHLSCVKYNLLLKIQTETKLLSQQTYKDKDSQGELSPCWAWCRQQYRNL